MKVLYPTFIIISFCLSSMMMYAQSLEIELSTEGVVFPRMGTEYRDGLSPVQGQCIYNTETLSIECFDGEKWNATLTNYSSERVFNSKQSTVLRPPDQANSDSYGRSCDLDGNYIIVGDAYEDDLGAVYIYHHNGVEWNQQERLIEENGDDDFQFGYSVSISNDYAIVGSVLTIVEGEEVGVVYIYKRNGQNWSICDTLIAFDGVDADRFGESVVIDDELIIVGAPEVQNTNVGQGAAYIYKLENDDWVLDTLLKPLIPDQHDFGRSVSITQDYAVVSAPSDKSILGELGSVFIYKRTASGWELEQNIRPSDGISLGRFGQEISVHNNDLLVGGDIYTQNGRVYYFERSDDSNTWNEEQILQIREGLNTKHFGEGISLFENRASVISVKLEDDGSQVGEVSIFQKNGSVWQVQKTFTPLGVTSGFDSVALSKDCLIIGSSGFTTAGVLKGGLFIF